MNAIMLAFRLSPELREELGTGIEIPGYFQAIHGDVNLVKGRFEDIKFEISGSKGTISSLHLKVFYSFFFYTLSCPYCNMYKFRKFKGKVANVTITMERFPHDMLQWQNTSLLIETDEKVWTGYIHDDTNRLMLGSPRVRHFKS
jgi:Cytochrome oxidase complex assembly protein 1